MIRSFGWPAGTLMIIQAIPPQGWVFAGWIPGQWSGITTASGSFTLVRPVNHRSGVPSGGSGDLADLSAADEAHRRTAPC